MIHTGYSGIFPNAPFKQSGEKAIQPIVSGLCLPSDKTPVDDTNSLILIEKPFRVTFATLKPGVWSPLKVEQME